MQSKQPWAVLYIERFNKGSIKKLQLFDNIVQEEDIIIQEAPPQEWSRKFGQIESRNNCFPGVYKQVKLNSRVVLIERKESRVVEDWIPCQFLLIKR